MTRAACLAKLERITRDLSGLTQNPQQTKGRDLNLLFTVAAAAADLRELLPDLGRALASESRIATSVGTVAIAGGGGR